MEEFMDLLKLKEEGFSITNIASITGRDSKEISKEGKKQPACE